MPGECVVAFVVLAFVVLADGSGVQSLTRVCERKTADCEVPGGFNRPTGLPRNTNGRIGTALHERPVP